MNTEYVYSKDERNFRYGIRSLGRWAKNPVSADGPKHIFRLIYAMFGPEVHKVAERMREKPETADLLDRGIDLGMLLADMERLQQCPEGSVGKVYHEFMSGEDIIPGYVIGGMVYRDGHFDKLIDWDDDALFLIERGGNTHDITHIISGYGTDLCGEIMNIAFSIGGLGIPRSAAKGFGAMMAVISWPVAVPGIPIKDWVAVNMDAGDRGAIMAESNSLIEIPYEDILEMPVADARKKLNVPPHKKSLRKYENADGWIASRDWMTGFIGKRAEQGFGEVDEAKQWAFAVKGLVEYGLPLKTVMSAKIDRVQQAQELLDRGEPQDTIEAVLA